MSEAEPLSPKQAASRLGISTRTARAWLRSGYLRGWRAGPAGHWKIERAEVERLRRQGGPQDEDLYPTEPGPPARLEPRNGAALDLDADPELDALEAVVFRALEGAQNADERLYRPPVGPALSPALTRPAWPVR